jgi:putative ABC transport system permease protein
MLRTTIKNVLARKLRLLTTGLAVLLGVAFLSGSLVLTDTIGKMFDDLFTDVYAKTDAYVRAEQAYESSDPSTATRPRVSQELLETVKAVPGVRTAEGEIFGYAQLVGSDGKALGNPGQGAPTLGGNWPASNALNPFELTAGRAPIARNEVVIDQGSADKGDLALDDIATVLTKVGPVEVRIVGIATFGEVKSMAGASYVGFTLPTAQEVVAEPGKFDGISVLGQGDVGQEELRDRISAAVPDGMEAITGAELTKESQDAIKELLAFFGTFMLIFALIALFVGSFIIYNTFSILVAQRTREMALMRAIGASRRQVLGSVLGEAFIIGALAGVVGLGAGVGVAVLLKALLEAVGMMDSAPTGVVMTRGTVVWSLLVGVVVSVAAAYFPARRGAKVPPIAAMRDVAVERPTRLYLRLPIGGLITGGGVGILALGLMGDSGNALALVGVGAVLVLLGVAALGPAVARPASRLIGAPLPRLRGMTGTLARENAMRNPKRTSTTAAALMVGVALVGFITIFASSAKASIDKTFDAQFTGDFVIDSGTFGFGGISPELANQLRDVPELDVVTSTRAAGVLFNGGEALLMGADAASADRIVDIGVLAGSLDGLDATGLAVHEKKAKSEGWIIGSTVPVVFAATGQQELTVRAIYSDDELVGSYFVGMPVFDANVPDRLDMQVFATLADGVSIDEGRAAIDAVAAAYPNADVLDREEFKDVMAGEINQVLNLVYALLLLAIAISLLGIMNTLYLSIVERTRELGLLRAVGMTRGQLRSAVRWEAVLIAVFGTLGGLGVGVFFSWAVVEALASEGFSTYVIPVTSLAVIAVIAALAGVLAAVLPARRASRLDILKAIATE